MKKFISILICFSLILSLLCANTVLAEVQPSTSEPRVSPGEDWSLINVIDFEKDSGFELNSIIKENVDTPTGWYLNNVGGASANFTAVSNFPKLNQDAISVKFKLWASDDWTRTEYLMVSFGPAGVCIYPKTYTATATGSVTAYAGNFCGATANNAWGSTPFVDENKNTITYKNGWNDIEIRLFKETAGPDEYYTSAEYYFNGVKATASTQTKGLIPVKERLSVADTSYYPLAFRCGGSAPSPYRVDEIYIYERTSETLEKLNNPVVNLYEGNILGFAGFDNNVKSYVARLYKDENLISTITKKPEESMFVDFSGAVSEEGYYEYSVQMKGDLTHTISSDEVFYSDTTELSLPTESPAKTSAPQWQEGLEDNKQVLTWEPLTGASYYNVKLYKAETLLHTIYGVPENSIDLTEYMLAARSGDYTAKVWGVNYQGAGEESDISATCNYNDGLPTQPPAQPDAPQWQNNTTVLTWEELDETDAYDVKLYKTPETTQPIATVTDISQTSYDLYNYMLLNGEGNYIATVEGKNIEGNGTASSPSSEFVYLYENYRNSEYLCNFESPAYNAGDNLSNTTDYSAIISEEGFNSNGQYLKLTRAADDASYTFNLPAENADVASVSFLIYLNSNETVNVSTSSTVGEMASFEVTAAQCPPAKWHKGEIRMTKTVSGENKPYTKAEYLIDGIRVGESTFEGAHKTINAITFVSATGADNAIYIDDICADNFIINPVRDEANVDAQIADMEISKIISGDKIVLPFSDNAAIDISWSSKPEGIILSNGDVNSPSYSGADTYPYTNVTLTATVKKGTISKQKNFNVTVMHKSALGNLAANANRRWISANSVFALDLREEKTFNCVVLGDLSNNVRKIALKYGDDLAELDEFTSFYTSDSSVESIISLPSYVTTRYVILEIIDCASGAVTLNSLDLYNFETYDTILETASKVLDIGKLNGVTSNIELPTTGLSGTLISWSSSKPEIISPSGVVNRPTGKKATVKLTATVSMEGTDLTKTVVFTATVLPVSQSSGGGVSGSSGSLHSGGGSGLSGGSVIATPTVTASSNFSDIKGHWAEEYINSLKKKGIVKGDSFGNFNPEAKITRAELVAMVIRALGISEGNYAGQFSDVSANDWFAGVVQASLDAGLISKDVIFRPNDSITREEIAKVIVQSVGDKAQSIDADSNLTYPDKDSIGSWAVEYVNTATELGLMSGMGDGSFAPKGIATRAQAATVIERMLTLISK